jgi:hypothetical protein
LRNRVGDLREQLDHSRAEATRLIDQYSAERQRLIDHHKAEVDRLIATSKAAAHVPAAPPPPPAPAIGTAADGGVLQSARRWLFGDEADTKPPSQVNQRSVLAQKATPPYQARPTAPPTPAQAPAPAPAQAPAAAKASVVKPVGPPTAPKILNRRPVS